MGEITAAMQEAIATGSMESGMSIWFLIGACLVFFMQCGFAMVETGFTRSKSAGNIIMKNALDFSLGTVFFLFLGYGLMMGENVLCGFVGLPTLGNVLDFGGSNWSDFFFQLVFCATTATIVSGSMAERTKFSAYLIYAIVIAAIIYPVEAHWVWGGGWLSDMGFIDWAGSAVIHMCGGTAALVGAAILGPRLGKYNEDGTANAIPGHSITLGALGVFILWFGWYGFNGAAASSIDGMAQCLSTTTIATAVAVIATMITTWVVDGKPDVSMTLNGALAGLVAITAPCAYVDAIGSVVIGLIAGIIVVFSVKIIDTKIKIDDPVGAGSVHGVCGLWGALSVGLFACPTAENPAEEAALGLFYGGGVDQLVTQLIGCGAILAWTIVTSFILFFLINKTVGLRVPAVDEVEGLDASEHGLASAYADFVPSAATFISRGDEGVEVEGLQPAALPGGDYSIVTIMCNADSFTKLKDTLGHIGISGMTVSSVMGCGVQKGKVGQYRGVETQMSLLPKLKVEVVVGDTDPGLVVAAARKALNTGTAGDGKIFVSAVRDVMRVSTGEVGVSALSYDE